MIHSAHCSIAPNTNHQTEDHLCTKIISQVKKSSSLTGMTELGTQKNYLIVT